MEPSESSGKWLFGNAKKHSRTLAMNMSATHSPRYRLIVSFTN